MWIVWTIIGIIALIIIAGVIMHIQDFIKEDEKYRISDQWRKGMGLGEREKYK